MRLLFVNPNTSAATSAWVRQTLDGALLSGESAQVETAGSGPAYLATREDMRIGAVSATECSARCLPGEPAFDAVVLACFADLESTAMAASFGLPVVGLLGASIVQAGHVGRRWSMVTAGAAWRHLLPDMVRASPQFRGQGELVSVRTFEPAQPRSPSTETALALTIERLCHQCREEDGADVVIVGGAGWAGMAPGNAGFPVIDSVVAGLATAREMAISAAPRFD